MKTWRRVQAGDTIRVDAFDLAVKESDFLDKGTGVYTTPVNGRYRFRGFKLVEGEGDVRMCLCGGDGRRVKMTGGGRGRSGWWVYDDVHWYCPEGLAVWVEIKGRSKRGRGDFEITDFRARFGGGFEDCPR